MLHKKIREDMTNAMRAKDAGRLMVLRGLLTAFTNEAVTRGKKPDVELSDDEAILVIKKASKQRVDSILQFKKGNRMDLAEVEEKELSVLKEYLPEEMKSEDIEKIARAKKDELGISDKSKMGILMGAVMKETGGRADGGVVKEIVSKLFE